MDIYRCSILDHCMNFARIPDSQELARINAFMINMSASRVSHNVRVLYGCIANLRQIFLIGNVCDGNMHGMYPFDFEDGFAFQF